jgi:hypothetical protein
MKKREQYALDRSLKPITGVPYFMKSFSFLIGVNFITQFAGTFKCNDIPGPEHHGRIFFVSIKPRITLQFQVSATKYQIICRFDPIAN